MSATDLSVKQLWRSVAPEARARAAAELAQLKGTEEWPSEVDDAVAAALNFRPAKIRSASAEEAGRWLHSAMLQMWPGALRKLLVTLHVTCRPTMLAQLYDAVGVEHQNGEASEEASQSPLALDPAIEAVPGLIHEYGFEDTRLFIHMLRIAGFEAWVETAKALCAEVEARPRPTIEEQPETATGGPDTASTEAALEEEEALRSIPGFTTLDRTLIRAIISSLNNVQGSLSLDELDDLVGEVVELNESRERSQFFVGYLDALLERDQRPMQGGDNDNRRAWYLSGYLHGIRRIRSIQGMLRCLDGLDDEDAERLRTARCDAGSLLAGELIPILLREDRIDDAVDWIFEHLSAASDQVLGPIGHWSHQEVVSGSAESARCVLEAVLVRLPERHPARREFRRRLGTALRRCGRADESRKIVEDLLADPEDEIEEAGLLSDRALLDLGVSSLELLSIASPDTRETLISAIDKHRDSLRDAADRPVHTPIPPLLLALPTVLDRDRESERDEARAWLEKANDCIRKPSFWRAAGILQIIEFGRSVLELRALDSAMAPEAANRLAGVFADVTVEPPLDLVAEALDILSLTEAPGGGRTARIALERWPNLLGRVQLDDLAARNSDLRRAVLEALHSAETLDTGERWTAWTGLLTASLAASPRDLNTARESLDQLEILAHEGREESLLELLEDTKNWDPAWDRLERDEARIRLLESTGNLPQAAAELTNLIHRAITADHDAEDLLDRLRTLPHDPDQIVDLERRVEATLETDDKPETEDAPKTPVRVLFVGGNETQMRYQERIECWLAEAHPGCTVDFEFSGWTSNWGKIVNRLQGRLSDADCLVIMRFTRTMLGKTLRLEADEHGIPWLPCSGHGLDSLKRSIAKAIAFTRRQTTQQLSTTTH